MPLIRLGTLLFKCFLFGNNPLICRYWTHERPAVPVTYTFAPWNGDTNTMMLIPPANLVSSTSVPSSYRIQLKLNMNPFLPISYVTSIYRIGVGVEDVLLGEFECAPPSDHAASASLRFIFSRMAVNYSRAVITMGNYSTRISNVLKKINSSAACHRFSERASI